MTNRVLIIGGAGFIGSHTADLLASKGYDVRILDNLDSVVHDADFPDFVKNKGYELMKGDASDRSGLEKALEGVDKVIHLAAHQDQVPNFSKFYDVNTKSVALLYEIIHQKNLPVDKVVYASSQFVYGDGVYVSSRGEIFAPELRSIEQMRRKEWDVKDSEGKMAEFIPFREEQEVNPTNSYGLSKVASERFILRVGKTFGIPSAIARYSIVQGARQSPKNIYSGALRIFVTQALAGEPITVYEDGKQLRDFVNVEDVARANVLLMESQESNFEIFNVGGGKEVSVLEFAEKVKEITGSSSRIFLDGSFRRTDTRNAVSDIMKITNLGWRPLNGIEKSIRDYAAWVKQRGFDAERLKKSREELERLGVVAK